MRKPRYLSPTQINLFYRDRKEYYLNYLSPNKPNRMPQTKHMAVGSAFDACIKSYLQVKLFGNPSEGFSYDELLEQQVEEQHRGDAKRIGNLMFGHYKASGALAELMLELESAVERPRFETTLEGDVPYEDCIDGIPFLGKPDLQFLSKNGMVVYDWKVNNYYGTRKMSPKKGYIWSDGKIHKDVILQKKDGLTININHCMSEVDKTWADQICIYSWVLGADVGSDFIVGIDQLACQPSGEVRVSRYRNNVRKDYQVDLYNRARNMWHTIEDGHIFDHLPRKESDAECHKLDNYAKTFKEQGDWFEKQVRGW